MPRARPLLVPLALLLALAVPPAEAFPGWKSCTPNTATCTQGSVMPVNGLALGNGFACALLAYRAVDCYGDNPWGQADDYNAPGLDPSALQVSAGEAHTCALVAGGHVDCWGYYGTDYLSGTSVAVAAGTWHTCALQVNGTVWCWGRNWEYQSEPYWGGDAIAVTAGTFHSCALTSLGNVNCWGFIPWGPAYGNYTGGDAVAIAANNAQTCAITTAGNVVCWSTGAPTTVYAGGNATTLSASHVWNGPVDHVCWTTTTGDVGCAGDNTQGQSNPIVGMGATRVVVGPGTTCILKSTPGVWCQGLNHRGQGSHYPN